MFLTLRTRAWNLHNTENRNVLQQPMTPVVSGLAIRGILCAVVSGCRHVDCASHLCHVVPRWRIHLPAPIHMGGFGVGYVHHLT